MVGSLVGALAGLSVICGVIGVPSRVSPQHQAFQVSDFFRADRLSEEKDWRLVTRFTIRSKYRSILNNAFDLDSSAAPIIRRAIKNSGEITGNWIIDKDQLGFLRNVAASGDIKRNSSFIKVTDQGASVWANAIKNARPYDDVTNGTLSAISEPKYQFRRLTGLKEKLRILDVGVSLKGDFSIFFHLSERIASAFPKQIASQYEECCCDGGEDAAPDWSMFNKPSPERDLVFAGALSLFVGLAGCIISYRNRNAFWMVGFTYLSVIGATLFFFSFFLLTHS